MNDLKNTYQLWFPIIFFIVLLTLLSSYLVMKFSWSIGTDWVAFERHVYTWQVITKEFINFNDEAYLNYKRYVVNRGYTNDLLIHTLTPFIISLISSSYLVFRWLWVKGGIDKAIHVSGPRLYKDKFAIRHARKSLKKEMKNG
jgi:hypothetical protein